MQIEIQQENLSTLATQNRVLSRRTYKETRPMLNWEEGWTKKKKI